MFHVDIGGVRVNYFLAEDDEKVAHFPWEQAALDEHFAGVGDASTTETVDDGSSVGDDDVPTPENSDPDDDNPDDDNGGDDGS